jgi:flagellar biosynthesis/type III secretory pathway protein FliH
MTAFRTASRRVVRDIEVRDLLPMRGTVRSVYTDEDLDDAYRRGAVDARTAMTTEREDAVRGIATSLRDWSVALRDALDAMRTHYSERVIDDAFTFATWLMCREVTADPNVMRVRIEEALAGIADEPPTLSVAPTMTETVAAWVPGATIRSDATLQPGEVRIVTSSTTIDGTFDDALRRLRAAFAVDPTGEVTR